ncbi:hypothetical protein [Paracoccus fontiphilus]|uniref:Uncharacterized protein n=1 Tax=Paracoccus fontiphilus TaxID=1815556 RepID=A0ABV7IB21_9RHOB|nr:hypothetical protein [Paracoccus fontiphilus]
MFDFSKHPTSLHLFIEQNADALSNAAMTLGGLTWLRRIRKIIDEVRLGQDLTRRTRVELQKYYGLLTLRHVADPDSEESSFFANLDPASPVVEEICLLTDQLEDAALEAGLILVNPAETDACNQEYSA